MVELEFTFTIQHLPLVSLYNLLKSRSLILFIFIRSIAYYSINSSHLHNTLWSWYTREATLYSSMCWCCHSLLMYTYCFLTMPCCPFSRLKPLVETMMVACLARYMIHIKLSFTNTGKNTALTFTDHIPCIKCSTIKYSISW